MHLNQRKFSILVALFLFLGMVSGYCYASTLEVHVTGIDGAPLKNVQDMLAISQAEIADSLNETSVQGFLKNAPDSIQKALQPFGFFQAQVQSHLTYHNDVWKADFKILPGPALYITSVNVSVVGPGKFYSELQNAIKTFPIKTGQVFNAMDYEEAKQNLFQTATDLGYLKAFFEEKQIGIDIKKQTVAIILKLNTGPRFYFGPVRFNQNTFSEKFLERFLSFREGEPFSSEKLIKFQQNLSSSSFFQEINVTPLLQDTDMQHVPIKVDLTASKSQRYNFGAGYGTFTGPRLTLGTSFRHLTNTGHHLDMQVKISSVLSGLAAQYVIPGENPLTDQYTIGANVQRFTPKNGNSMAKSLSLGYVKAIEDWKWTGTVSYLREHYNIIDNASHNSRIVYPSLGITRIKADDLINTRFGNKIDLVVRGASTKVVSNVTFLQADMKGKIIYSPTEASRLIGRGEFGYTTVQDLNLLPISLQFYAGGIGSVRGFPYSYFGPGRYLKTASIELEHRIYDNISGAVFYDVGTADNHINSPMGHGTGLGLIYESSIGPIKGYLGFGRLKGKPNHFAFEFSLGPDL